MATTCSAVTVDCVVVVSSDVLVTSSNDASDADPDVAPTIATAAMALAGTRSSPATTDAVSFALAFPPVPRSAISFSFVSLTDGHTMRDAVLTLR